MRGGLIEVGGGRGGAICGRAGLKVGQVLTEVHGKVVLLQEYSMFVCVESVCVCMCVCVWAGTQDAP